MSLHDHLQLYLNLGLTLVPLRFHCKQLPVRCGNGCNPAREDLMQWSLTTNRNGCDSDVAFRNFAATHDVPAGCPVVKTGRGYHIWGKPKKPIKSQRINGVEIKYLGNYVVAPPSIHLSGVPYVFEIASNGTLPEVDFDTLLWLPTDSSMCQVQRIHATTWLGLKSLPRCGKVELVQAGKDG